MVDVVPVTALISWARQDPGWSPEQIDQRREQVLRLAVTLREQGIDADLDLFHGDVDWTRWGPQRVRDVDVVLIVVSRAWTEAWEGRGDLTRNIGAAAEADVLRSISTQSRDALRAKCRLVVLPGIGGDRAVIPDGLHGIARFGLDTIDVVGLEELLRDLTGQPRYPIPPLGQVPVLPAALTEPDTATRRTYDTDPTAAAVASPNPSTGASGSTGHDDSVKARRDQLEAQLAALPSPLPGEGPALPWYREWERVQRELAALPAPIHASEAAPTAPTTGATGLADRASIATSGPAGGAPVPVGVLGELAWVAAHDVDVEWHDRSARAAISRSCAEYASVYVHLILTPSRRISARVFAQASAQMPQMLRDRGLVTPIAGLDVAEGDDVTAVRVAQSRSAAFDAAVPGGPVGARLAAAGSASAWAELPRDTTGAVIDPDRLAADIAECVNLAAAALAAAGIDVTDQVAMAAEITPITMITTGTLEQLGNRNNASMRGATARGPIALNAEESLPLGDHLDHSDDVASIDASLLIRTWGKQ